MKYRIVHEFLCEPDMFKDGKFPYPVFGDWLYTDLVIALARAKKYQDEDYPKVLTHVEDENRVRYDHEVK